MIHSLLQLYVCERKFYHRVIFEFQKKKKKQNFTKKKKGIDYYPGNRKYSKRLDEFFWFYFHLYFVQYFLHFNFDRSTRMRTYANVFDIPSHVHEQSTNGFLPSFSPFINWKNRTIFGCLWSGLQENSNGAATLFAIAPECLARF